MMNVAELQAVYFLLNVLSGNDFKVKLIVKQGCETFTADFLEQPSNRSVLVKDFDYDFDVSDSRLSIEEGTKENYLWAIVCSQWNKTYLITNSHSYKQLANPDILLPKVIAFVENVSLSSDYKCQSNIAYNVVYFDGQKFDFCMLPDISYEILTIEVSKN